MDVRILAASDTHGIVPFKRLVDACIRREADILAVAGDVQTCYRNQDPEKQFEDDVLAGVRSLEAAGVDVVLVPGNHDSHLKKLIETRASDWMPRNLHVMCDAVDVVRGVSFYGTPRTPTFRGWCWETPEQEFASVLSATMPKCVDIILSHSPPLGTGIDRFDLNEDRRHCGSEALRRAVERQRPKAVVCGHIHEGDHKTGRIGDTVVMNVSLIDGLYIPAFAPAEIVVDVNGRVTCERRGWED